MTITLTLGWFAVAAAVLCVVCFVLAVLFSDGGGQFTPDMPNCGCSLLGAAFAIVAITLGLVWLIGGAS